MTLVIRGPVHVQLVATPSLDAQQHQRVDACWQAELAQRHLVDGQLLSVIACRALPVGSELSLAHVPYRWWLAQRRLGQDLGVRPLAVCGLAMDPAGRLLIGQRGAAVTDHPGRWELVPSGSCELNALNQLDPRLDAQRELSEEAGLQALSAEVLGLIHDPAECVYEIGVRVRLAEGRPVVRDEHDQLRFISAVDLAAYDPVSPALALFALHQELP